MFFSGYVCLIGAGPGHSGWVTRQGLGYLKRADVVLYDHLIPVQLLLETKPGCELISVGKECGKHSVDQETINRLLITQAKAGHFVVRLKGGDPFLFGRGGEEAEALVGEGIPYILVPGISSSLSVPTAAGIPVTHRRLSHGVMIRTGHQALSLSDDTRMTQVVLMSVNSLDEVVKSLISQGYPETTPAVVISRGSTPFQQILKGNLTTIALKVTEKVISHPALLVAGETVNLASVLDWTKYLPLHEKRILWTRPYRDEDQNYLEDLDLLGAEVIRLPLYQARPFPQETLVGQHAEIAGYSWIVFTSGTAVEIFSDSMVAAGQDWSYFAGSKIAVVGNKTGALLRKRGRNPDLTAEVENSQGLMQLLSEQLCVGERVALCQAEKTLPYLTAGMEEAGFDYRQYKLYQLECPEYPEDVIQSVFEDPFDVIIFVTPSAVTNYFNLIQTHRGTPKHFTRYACLGPETAARLTQAGYEPWLIPERPRMEELVNLLLEKWGVTKDVPKNTDAQTSANASVKTIINRT